MGETVSSTHTIDKGKVKVGLKRRPGLLLLAISSTIP